MTNLQREDIERKLIESRQRVDAILAAMRPEEHSKGLQLLQQANKNIPKVATPERRPSPPNLMQFDPYENDFMRFDQDVEDFIQFDDEEDEPIYGPQEKDWYYEQYGEEFDPLYPTKSSSTVMPYSAGIVETLEGGWAFAVDQPAPAPDVIEEFDPTYTRAPSSTTPSYYGELFGAVAPRYLKCPTPPPSPPPPMTPPEPVTFEDLAAPYIPISGIRKRPLVEIMTDFEDELLSKEMLNEVADPYLKFQSDGAQQPSQYQEDEAIEAFLSVENPLSAALNRRTRQAQLNSLPRTTQPSTQIQLPPELEEDMLPPEAFEEVENPFFLIQPITAQRPMAPASRRRPPTSRRFRRSEDDVLPPQAYLEVEAPFFLARSRPRPPVDVAPAGRSVQELVQQLRAIQAANAPPPPPEVPPPQIQPPTEAPPQPVQQSVATSRQRRPQPAATSRLSTGRAVRQASTSGMRPSTAAQQPPSRLQRASTSALPATVRQAASNSGMRRPPTVAQQPPSRLQRASTSAPPAARSSSVRERPPPPQAPRRVTPSAQASRGRAATGQAPAQQEFVEEVSSIIRDTRRRLANATNKSIQGKTQTRRR